MENDKNSDYFKHWQKRDGLFPTPETYSGIAIQIDESVANELAEKGVVKTTIIKSVVTCNQGDVIKINERLFAKIKNLNDKGAQLEIELGLLGD